MKNSLDSKLQIYFICSIRIRTRKQDIFEKPQQLNSSPFVQKENGRPSRRVNGSPRLLQDGVNLHTVRKTNFFSSGTSSNGKGLKNILDLKLKKACKCYIRGHPRTLDTYWLRTLNVSFSHL